MSSESELQETFLNALKKKTGYQLTFTPKVNPLNPEENGYVLSYQKKDSSTRYTADTLKATLKAAFGKVGVNLQDGDMTPVDLPQADTDLLPAEQGIWIRAAIVSAAEYASKTKPVPEGAINPKADQLNYNFGQMAWQLAHPVRSVAQVAG